MSQLGDLETISNPRAPLQDIVAAAKRSPLHAEKILDNIGFVAQTLANPFNVHDAFGPTLALKFLQRVSARPSSGATRLGLLLKSDPLGVTACLRQYPPSAEEFRALTGRLREIQDEQIQALYFGELASLDHADLAQLREAGGDEDLRDATESWVELIELEQRDPEELARQIEAAELFAPDLLMLARASRSPEVQAALMRQTGVFEHVLQARYLNRSCALGASLFAPKQMAQAARQEAGRRGWAVSVALLTGSSDPKAPALAAGTPSARKAPLSEEERLAAETAGLSAEDVQAGWEEPLWP